MANESKFDPVQIPDTKEHAACGKGFFASREGKASHGVVEEGLHMFSCMAHRVGTNMNRICDGGGVMTEPHTNILNDKRKKLIEFQPDNANLQTELEQGNFGVARFTRPISEPIDYTGKTSTPSQKLIEEKMAEQGLTILFWDEVEIDRSVMEFQQARNVIPFQMDAVFSRPEGMEEKEFLLRHKKARDAIKKEISQQKEEGVHRGLNLVSLSHEMVSWAGAILPGMIGDVFPNLKDDSMESRFFAYHGRFSTNTPSAAGNLAEEDIIDIVDKVLAQFGSGVQGDNREELIKFLHKKIEAELDIENAANLAEQWAVDVANEIHRLTEGRTSLLPDDITTVGQEIIAKMDEKLSADPELLHPTAEGVTENGENNTIGNSDRGNEASFNHRMRAMGFDDFELPASGTDTARKSAALVHLVTECDMPPEKAIISLMQTSTASPDMPDDEKAMHEWLAIQGESFCGPSALTWLYEGKGHFRLDNRGFREFWVENLEDRQEGLNGEREKYFYAGSEPGLSTKRVEPGPKNRITLTGGDLVTFDIGSGKVRYTEEIMKELVEQGEDGKSYDQLMDEHTVRLEVPTFAEMQTHFRENQSTDIRGEDTGLTRAQRATVYGWSAETRTDLAGPIICLNKPQVAAMGGDTEGPGNDFSVPVPFSHRMRREGAQITNPSVNAAQQKESITVRTRIGPRLKSTLEQGAKSIIVENPMLGPGMIEQMEQHTKIATIGTDFNVDGAERTSKEALERISKTAIDAVRRGATVVVLDDGDINRDKTSLEDQLVARYVHKNLRDAGLVDHASLVFKSHRVASEHDLATLFQCGVSAVYAPSMFAEAERLFRPNNEKELKKFFEKPKGLKGEREEARLKELYKDELPGFIDDLRVELGKKEYRQRTKSGSFKGEEADLDQTVLEQRFGQEIYDKEYGKKDPVWEYAFRQFSLEQAYQNIMNTGTGAYRSIMSEKGTDNHDSYRQCDSFCFYGVDNSKASKIMNYLFPKVKSPLLGDGWGHTLEHVTKVHEIGVRLDPDQTKLPNRALFGRGQKDTIVDKGEVARHALSPDAVKELKEYRKDERIEVTSDAKALEDLAAGEADDPRTQEAIEKIRRRIANDKAALTEEEINAHRMTNPFKKFADERASRIEKYPVNPRDFVNFRQNPDHPDEVSREEFKDKISDVLVGPTSRISFAPASLGALTKEQYQVFRETAFNLGGMRVNTGEGGEVHDYDNPSVNSNVGQLSANRNTGESAAEFLAKAIEHQQKLGQGAKWGRGGKLPSIKVTPEVAARRGVLPFTDQETAPTQFTIQSIEDLISTWIAQSPFARQQGLKIVSGSTLAMTGGGAAKTLLAVGTDENGIAGNIMIDGASGGTAAADLTSIQLTGMPWELVADLDEHLKKQGIRKRVKLEVTGGIIDGNDLVKALAMGADSVGMVTAFMMKTGCVLAKTCHAYCPGTGNATPDRPFDAESIELETFIMNIADQAIEIVRSLGFESLEEIVGRRDILETMDREKMEELGIRGNLDLRRIAGPDNYTTPQPDTPLEELQRHFPRLERRDASLLEKPEIQELLEHGGAVTTSAVDNITKPPIEINFGPLNAADIGFGGPLAAAMANKTQMMYADDEEMVELMEKHCAVWESKYRPDIRDGKWYDNKASERGAENIKREKGKEVDAEVKQYNGTEVIAEQNDEGKWLYAGTKNELPDDPRRYLRQRGPRIPIDQGSVVIKTGAIPDDTGKMPEGAIEGGGQKYGAFMVWGMELHHTGVLPKDVGECAGPGTKIVVKAPDYLKEYAKDNDIAGHHALYASMGGIMHAEGGVGDLACVNDKGGILVCEGVGKKAASGGGRGMVLNIGERNKGESCMGDSGCIMVQYNAGIDYSGKFTGDTNLYDFDVRQEYEALVHSLIKDHLDLTGSTQAQFLLENWQEERKNFTIGVPKAAEKLIEEGRIGAIEETFGLSHWVDPASATFLMAEQRRAAGTDVTYSEIENMPLNR